MSCTTLNISRNTVKLVYNTPFYCKNWVYRILLGYLPLLFYWSKHEFIAPFTHSHHNNSQLSLHIYTLHPPKYPIFDHEYTIFDIFSPTSETKCNENAGEMKITPHFISHI